MLKAQSPSTLNKAVLAHLNATMQSIDQGVVAVSPVLSI